MTITNENETPKKSLNFIEQMVENDLKEGTQRRTHSNSFSA